MAKTYNMDGSVSNSISQRQEKKKKTGNEIMAHKGKGSCGSKGKGGKKGYR